MLPDRVIRHGRVEPERWTFLGLEGEVPAALPAGPLVVPLATWSARRDELAARREPVGVWLEPVDEPAALSDGLDALALVAVRFPKFADGRGFSTAVLLRTRHGFKGELRAFGDVARDQLFHLSRCGFDAFSLPPGRDPEAALASLAPYTLRYQASVDEPLPLYLRRLAAAG